MINPLLSLIGVMPGTRLAGALEFFVEDSIKVLLLLFIMVSAIGVLRTYMSKAFMEKYLGSQNRFISTFFAALFAIFTPFCSCSSIPIFIGLLKMRVSFAAAISFLAVSPLVNEYLTVLIPAYYSVSLMAVYVVGGIALGMTGGYILEKLGLEKDLEDSLKDSAVENLSFTSFKERFKFGVAEGADITKKLWLWILAGVALGAWLHNYVPDELVTKAANFGGIFSVPIMAIAGAPIYASCAGVVPIAVIMFGKTLPLGTTLAFLMSASAISLPEAVLLRSVMKLKLLAAFFLMVLTGIIILGYFINFMQPYLV